MRRLAITIALVAATTGGFASLASAQHDEEESGHGEHADHGSAEGGEAEHGRPELFWTTSGPEGEPALAGRLLAFALWLGILVYFGRAPLQSFLTARRKGILDGLEEAKRVEAAANAKYDEYSARIENLDAEIAKLRADFERAGMEERDRMVAAAAEKAHKLHAEAHFLVQQQVKSLREELTREAIDAAVVAAEKILRERATAADQQRLADEYLSRLRASVERGTSASGPKGAS